ncbi:MAG: phosphomannomutase/phosphoglucomutase [Oscillospiraceae bacterium]|jgi:phosphomannomutase|nr:phosphomannomutase/phosphoglucomutase [Oscillospiraceae bacterium]
MLLKLQNGSDIRGVAIETKESKISLSPENCALISSGFVKLLKEKTGRENLKIAVGMDSRLSGPGLKSALAQSLAKMGCFVLDCGMATTPAMFMACVPEGYDCDGSIMVTASHLPYYYNGMKFFSKSGGCEALDIKYILENSSPPEPKNGGKIQNADLIGVYSDFLIDLIRAGINSPEDYERPLAGFKIAVDAGNGAGGFFAEKVLARLGADVSASQFLSPDGNFPNHMPNPENAGAMRSIREATVKGGADLGIIFDTDVDRSAIVGKSGREINRNALIALSAAIVLEENPGGVIVTDSVTSAGLPLFIAGLGGKHRRFKRGYRNVIGEAIRLNREGISAPLAIETSGHAALRENYFLDDGAYLSAKIIIKAARLRREVKTVEDLLSDLKQPLETKNLRLKISAENFKACGDQVLAGLGEFVKTAEGWSAEGENYEGLRVNCEEDFGNGWFLLRLSLHEPLMPLDIESDSPGGCDYIAGRLRSFLGGYKFLQRF